MRQRQKLLVFSNPPVANFKGRGCPEPQRIQRIIGANDGAHTLNTATLTAWASPDGRVGRRDYWLGYVLPSLGLSSIGIFAHPLGLAALYLFAVGALKRSRDLKMSTGRAAALAGVWVTSMIVATVIAGGVFLFGLFAIMGNGGPDGESILLAALLIFLAPVVAVPLMLGMVPGSPQNQTG